MLLALGFGYTAHALAERWRDRGIRIVGTTRNGAERHAGADECLRFDAASALEEIRARIREARYVVVSIPPDAEGDIVLRRLGDDFAAARNIAWLAYLSSTGVYGDHAGAWVDETSERRARSGDNARRAAAEDGWLELWARHGLPVHLFRIAGIYGPRRSAFDSLRAGTARRIDKPGHVFSRIHVADIAAVLDASAARPRPGSIYNVADGAPSANADVVAHAAALIGAAPPPLEPLETADLSPMARAFYAASRRISNARMLRELGVVLAHADYRSGLAAILAEETRAKQAGAPP